MKILTVIYNLEKGGTQRAAQVFTEGYKELGHDSKLLSLYGLGPRYDEIKNSIEVYDGFNSDNLNLIKRWQPDVIHIHSHGPKEYDILKLLDSLENKNLKVIETNVFSRPTFWSARLDCSLQLSSWCQWLYEQRGGLDYPKAIVANPIKSENFFPQSGIEIENFKESYNIPKDAFVIGRIGQSYEGKWSYTIIDIFNELANENQDLYLMIVNAPSNIIKMAKKSKSSNRIVIIDSIYGDKNLAIAYSSMNVFYLGVEQGESFGIVSTESILCGTPVIALATPWGDNSQGEVVQNNIGGHVVHHANSAVTLIKEYINGSRIYDEEKGINSIKERYDYIKVCKDALGYANTDKYAKPIITEKVIELLNDSYDKPNFLTVLFIRLNLKILTRYSSGYESWNKLFVRVYNKIKRLYNDTRK